MIKNYVLNTKILLDCGGKVTEEFENIQSSCNESDSSSTSRTLSLEAPVASSVY